MRDTRPSISAFPIHGAAHRLCPHRLSDHCQAGPAGVRSRQSYAARTGVGSPIRTLDPPKQAGLLSRRLDASDLRRQCSRLNICFEILECGHGAPKNGAQRRHSPASANAFDFRCKRSIGGDTESRAVRPAAAPAARWQGLWVVGGAQRRSNPGEPPNDRTNQQQVQAPSRP